MYLILSFGALIDRNNFIGDNRRDEDSRAHVPPRIDRPQGPLDRTRVWMNKLGSAVVKTSKGIIKPQLSLQK